MKELRCLVFTEQEVVKAVFDRRRKTREALPAGSVTGVTYTTEQDSVSTTIRMVGEDGAEQSMALSTAEVTAALVGYCMARKVPLPVDSDKCLYVIKGGLTLMITMNFNKPPRIVAESHAQALSGAAMASRVPRGGRAARLAN